MIARVSFLVTIWELQVGAMPHYTDSENEPPACLAMFEFGRFAECASQTVRAIVLQPNTLQEQPHP